MTITVSVQLSLGRFAVPVEPEQTLHQVKANMRTTIPALLQVNFKMFRFVTNDGKYLSDDSKTVKDYEWADGDIFHLVKKSVSPAAAVDLEKPADE
eukprot:CAMPEP_0174827282 /NCGR_PEP_ID=MMETSP1114-20130205/612_1 /TAXON_ID=312471 /ORGANISM="Neobodo designis, Strain CCAP 1951/1" /LENGTH=95 /DNA_ID=CAMNT_0016060911 /DNA_START=39 /DNA_END=326 /DNA_ORIENTATION=-